ncbi:hypothetical protein CDAR_172511 [Caerostris darwini]|uniref:Uncharacterized protein n=1 Tax=Caerostris darwini TaxID=1538125 RepID=A0AAV4ME98_9ARAC|nr:hypothetical protein CDAR_172511 [Caerostris darwini]
MNNCSMGSKIPSEVDTDGTAKGVIYQKGILQIRMCCRSEGLAIVMVRFQYYLEYNILLRWSTSFRSKWDSLKTIPGRSCCGRLIDIIAVPLHCVPL